MSTDTAAADPFGPAQDGEVEDYAVSILSLVGGKADSAKTKKIASGTSGAPPLVDHSVFGTSTASIGDIDGDGIGDLAVGTSASFYVLLMNADGTVKANQRIANGVGGGPTYASGDGFGSTTISAIGDLNGDGIPDIAVGAPFDDLGGTNRGAVYVLFMNSNGTVKSFQKLANNLGGIPTLTTNDNFGSSVASVGDFDGDGIPDLLAGISQDDTAGVSVGAVDLLFMNSNGTVRAIQKITPGTSGTTSDFFGSSVVSLGDLDGDGITDLAVGADKDGSGAVYIIFLNSNGTVKSRQKIASGVGGQPTLSDSFYGTSL